MDYWFAWLCGALLIGSLFYGAFEIGQLERRQAQLRYEQCLQIEGSYVGGNCILGRNNDRR